MADSQAPQVPAAKRRKAAPAERTVEEIYQKKTQLEHILLRPDSYVGSVERQSQDMFVFDDGAGRMVKRTLEYIPALYKIFDEILVNAADNMVRCPAQDEIRVEVNAEKGSISVWNNGAGVPVQEHKEHNCFVPELIFGHLLTSDNYDDSEKKVTGGRNGYGAKLTNIFSTRFVLETQDSNSGKRYTQVWEDNMGTCNRPEIKAAKGVAFTQITFFPDLKRFGMKTLEEDICALMRRRAYDVAAATHGRCKVVLDGKPLDVTSFEDYVSLYLAPETFRVCEVVNERWEVAVGLTDGSGFQQVSFVNSISTSRGGSHVNLVSDQLTNAVLERVSKQKGGGLAVKSSHVKGYLWVFVNCLIENPAFDSQTKETLTSKRERFGSQCQLPDHLIDQVLESGIVDALQEWSKAFGKSELAQHLNRSDLGLQKRLFGVPKLEDANKAGTKEGSDCTLILTEGDSAKALAVAGLAVVGRDHYGVFPLRGKLRNVRDLTVKQMMENKEIDQLLKIMALDATKEYTDTKSLRYGSIMIMTDQDHDGSHIKGLIINFIQQWFPSLLKLPGFLKEFVTPIVKVSKGDEEPKTFFTIPEYEEWKKKNNSGRGWKSKYYKGLGTSTSKEAKEYFSELQEHEIVFTHSGNSEDDDLIDMAFQSKRADERKRWISAVEEGTFVDHGQPSLSYEDFINKELVLFAQYDVQRAIPSVMDGFKPGQRKVLYGCFKKKLTKDIKVAQLAGYVAENSAYHHGEASLQGTIVGMAQNFVGSNNINILVPSGQFGTRLQGGKDHAAPRYIFTRMSRVARCIFPEEDDAVLEYNDEEGMQIEPKWYAPVLPMALVNGVEGIGTGWSSSIPNFNPRDIIANLRRFLKGEPLEPMQPWYRGFRGSVAPMKDMPGKYEAFGVVEKKGRVRLEIVELPVRRWTQDYKEWLVEQLPQPGAEKRAAITEIREHHTENSVHFVLSMTPDKLAEAERRGFEKVLHLRSNISTSNMWLFDPSGKIKKYATPEEVILEYAPQRLEVYQKRKANLIAKMEKELAVISNKLLFVQLVVNDTLDVEKRKSSELCQDLLENGLLTMRMINQGSHIEYNPEEADGPEGYRYLLSMKLWSLSDDRVAQLTKLNAEKEKALDELRGTSLETLWERDLARLEAALDQCDAEDAKEAALAAKMAAKHQDADDSSLTNRQCVIVLSSSGSCKRVRTSEWKATRRGKAQYGKALIDQKAIEKEAAKKKKAAEKMKDAGKEKDAEEDEEEAEDDEEAVTEALAGVFCCRDFDALLVFSEHGMVYKLQALDVPLAKKMSAPGTELKEFLPELGDHKITALVTVAHTALKDQSDEFVVLVSAKGMAKKVSIAKFGGLRPGKGVPAFKLAPGDELRWAHRATKDSALVCCTEGGFLLRCSLGQDWAVSSAKAPGKCVMKIRDGHDKIASSATHDLTPRELADVKAAMERKIALRLERQAAAAAGAGAEAGGEGTATGDAKMQKGADDDDSDNENAEEKMEVDEEDDKDDNEGGDDDGDDDDDAAPTAAPGAAAGSEAPAASAGEQDAGQCALIVTQQGAGLRMPISCKRIGLRRKGGKGMKVIKLFDGRPEDRVVSVCIVSSKDVQEPKLNQRMPWQLWEQEQAQAAAAAAAAAALLPVAETPETPEAQAPADPPARAGGDSEMAPAEPQVSAADKFNLLPEAEQQRYQQRVEEEKARYELAKEEFNKEEMEEVLLGSTSGLISRVRCGTIPKISKALKGKTIIKVRNGQLCAVSLLSSMDDDPDETKEKAAKPAPRLASRQAWLNRSLALAPAPSTPQAGADGDAGTPGRLSLTPPEGDRRRQSLGGKMTRILMSRMSPSGRVRALSHLSPLARGKMKPKAVLPSTIVKTKVRLLGKAAKPGAKSRSINLADWASKAAGRLTAAAGS